MSDYVKPLKLETTSGYLDEFTTELDPTEDRILINGIAIEDENILIYKDGSSNLTFLDSVTGTKTLAELLTPKLNDITNPNGNTLFTMTTNQIKFIFTNPAVADGGFEVEATGAFSGDLVHIHQHTGNPGATDLVHLEAEDSDVVPLRVVGVGTYDIITGAMSISGNIITTSAYLQFADISAPSNPSDGEGRLYKKTGNDGLFWLPDSGGSEVDLTVGGAATPGGSDKYVQFNDGGSTFGGDADFQWDKTANELDIVGTVDVTESYKIDGLVALKTPPTNNTFVGQNSGNAFIEQSGAGSFNVGVGYNSLYLLTTGDDNVAIGNSALASLVNGGDNIGIGSGSLGSTNGQYKNIGIGYQSGYTISNAGDDSNIFIGFKAGYDLATGEHNIMIGDTVAAGVTSGDDQLYIGTFITGNLTILTFLSNIILSSSGYIELSDMSAPANPGAGKGRIYKKTADDGIFWKPDAAGSEIDLTNPYATVSLLTTGNIVTNGGYIQFSDITAPSNPSDGEGRLYKKTGNDGLFWLPDSGGSEVDLTAAPAGNPAGNDTEVQFNDGGAAFGAESTFTYNKTGNYLTIPEIRAYDVNGLQLNDDAGNAGILIDDTGLIKLENDTTLNVANAFYLGDSATDDSLELKKTTYHWVVSRRILGAYVKVLNFAGNNDKPWFGVGDGITGTSPSDINAPFEVNFTSTYAPIPGDIAKFVGGDNSEINIYFQGSGAAADKEVGFSTTSRHIAFTTPDATYNSIRFKPNTAEIARFTENGLRISTDALDGSDMLEVEGNVIIEAGYIQFSDMTAPANPLDTEGRLYKKTGNDGLFWLPDSAGAEIDLTDGLGNIVEDTTPQLGANLDLNQFSIEFDPTPTADVTGNGEIITDDVDVNTVGIGCALHLDTDGNWIEAHADAAGDMPCKGIALETGTGSKKILLKGVMRNDAWNWTILGGPIYVSDTSSGGFTQTIPADSGEQVQVVGFALSADIIYFNPDNTVIEVA